MVFLTLRDILKAEDDYRRGYKDPSEKRELIQNLTNIDSFTLSLLGTVPGKLCEFYGSGFGRGGYELQRACRANPNNPAGYLLSRSLPSKYTLPIPTNRTQNPEEALEGSLLLFFTMNKTDFHPITPPDIIPSMASGWKSYLKEAFCRSVEPFSEVFDTRPKPRVETEEGETWLKPEKENFDDPVHRPPTCLRLPTTTYCARLYDSHTCSNKAWKLNIRDGEQRSFAYFSSDWKYRGLGLGPFPLLYTGTRGRWCRPSSRWSVALKCWDKRVQCSVRSWKVFLQIKPKNTSPHINWPCWKTQYLVKTSKIVTDPNLLFLINLNVWWLHPNILLPTIIPCS